MTYPAFNTDGRTAGPELGERPRDLLRVWLPPGARRRPERLAPLRADGRP